MLAIFQPFVDLNLKDGWYLRVSAEMSISPESVDFFVPVGLGAGKVFKVDDQTTLNA